MTKSDYKKLTSILSENSKIIITSHRNPDGDAVGSAMALYHTFKHVHKNLTIVLPNKFPDFLSWISESEKIRIYEEEAELDMLNFFADVDIVFCLDYNALSRLGDMEKAIQNSTAVKVLIDHHPDPDLEAFDFVLSKTAASSTAELVYEFLAEIKLLHHLDKAAAEGLYTGIITDTGSFSFSSNNPKTYRIVADMVEKGVDAEKSHRLIYDTFSENRLRLLGFAFNSRLLTFPAHHTAIIFLSKEDLDKFDYKPGDTEGIVNFPLSIKEINVSILMTQRDDSIRMSFRSKGEFAVNKIAGKYFDGGGHRNAAGGNSKLSMEETIEKIKEILPLYQDELDYVIDK